MKDVEILIRIQTSSALSRREATRIVRETLRERGTVDLPSGSAYLSTVIISNADLAQALRKRRAYVRNQKRKESQNASDK